MTNDTKLPFHGGTFHGGRDGSLCSGGSAFAATMFSIVWSELIIFSNSMIESWGRIKDWTLPAHASAEFVPLTCRTPVRELCCPMSIQRIHEPPPTNINLQLSLSAILASL